MGHWQGMRAKAGFVLACLIASGVRVPPAGAVVSEGNKRQLETGASTQGGGATSSSKFQNQSSIGDPVANVRIGGSKFRMIPGFLAAALSAQSGSPASELDVRVLVAKTAPAGTLIDPQAWQRDHDPFFLWEAPPTGPDVAGYSYAIDGEPDETIDTTGTSFDVASSPLAVLSDGTHTFAVKALSLAGTSGSPISFEIWIDTTPPQIVASSPAPAALLNTPSPSANATVTDAGSGVDASTITWLINGSAAPSAWNAELGVMVTTGGAWKEGVNSLELRAADRVGNAGVPLLWSVTLDTQPPTGAVTINGGEETTTSVYVRLGLEASDATSGLARILVSNDQAVGYVEEPYTTVRDVWKLNAIRGRQSVYVKFVDAAGNISAPASDAIELLLLSPETLITSGPAGFTLNLQAAFTFACPEGDCVFSFAFDRESWSAWSPLASAASAPLPFGNHYFRVKAAKDVNGQSGIQPDEEDPTPAERTWVVGVQPSISIPKGPPIKLWRLD